MGGATTHCYLVALGSNQRHIRYGRPAAIIGAAIEAAGDAGMDVIEVAPTISSRPVGPSLRTYANAAMVVASDKDPVEMLATLQAIEARFGRNRQGQCWRSRTLDLDIVLWSGGGFSAPGLTIPHPRFRERYFVLSPSVRIAADWRDPASGLSLRHLLARLGRPRPAVPRRSAAEGNRSTAGVKGIAARPMRAAPPTGIAT